jgi:peroxiredoxin
LAGEKEGYVANGVVGNYDVVVQVSLTAIDRFLAVMHECQRFLHSISGYVNDVPPPQPHLPPIVFTGVETALGSAIADQRLIPRRPFTGTVATNSLSAIYRPPIVNPGEFAPPRIIPSNLSGQVQMQIFPPTVDVPDSSGTNLSVTLNAMVRYFPDPKTAPIAQFLRGNLQIVAPLSQISTQVGKVLEFDIKANEVSVSFTPTYTSNALSIEDTVAINLAIQNALRTSFQPSSATLPGSVAALQFKTMLSGAQKAGALLLNLTSHSSTPASVQDIVLNAADDFAFAISPSYINSLLSSSIGQFSTFTPIPVSEWPFSATYTVTLTNPPPALNFTSGAIQLIINAHAHSSGSIFPSFNFSTVVSLGLNLIPIDASGRLGAAELVLSKVALDFTDSGLGGDLKDLILGAFKGTITNNVANAVINTLNSPDPNGIQATVRKQSNIDTQLGNLVNSLLTDPTTGDQPDASLKLRFSYTSVDIEPTAVILRGLEAVQAWADPYVEYDQIPSQPASGGGLGLGGGIVVGSSGPDYTALNSWIPGGTITQYVWSISYNNQLYPFGVDPNKFVLLHSSTGLEENDASVGGGASLPPYTPLCLTVQGTRISMSSDGPATAVSATSCGYRHLPLPGLNLGDVELMPTIALARPGANGQILVTGHAAPQAAGRAAANLLLHFADAKSAATLTTLMEALSDTKRSDAPTAVMAVVPQGHLEKLVYTPGLIYAENDAAWERAFGLGKAARPLTLIIDPTGKIVWRHEGAIEQGKLTAALTKTLAPTVADLPKILRPTVRLSQPAPNFLFEYSKGHELTLSKLKGRRVALVFWRSGSAPSTQAIVALLQAKNGAQPPLVLAINDGESAEHAHRVLAEKKISAITVADPGRKIATAYGVTAWPTIVSIDASGIISGVQIGYAEAAPGSTRQTSK